MMIDQAELLRSLPRREVVVFVLGHNREVHLGLRDLGKAVGKRYIDVSVAIDK